MKPKVDSETKLELRIINNQTIYCQGEHIKLSGSKDAAVLVLVTLLERRIISEQIVAVTTDTNGFLTLMSYVRADGGITFGRDLG